MKISYVIIFFLISTFAFALDSENEKFQGNNRVTVVGPFKKTLSKIIPKAKAGDPVSQYKLGQHYDYGWGVKKDLMEAARWYEKAATQNNLEAQHSLGLLYSGAGGYVFANPKKAVKWFRAAALKGHSSSQYFIGNAYKEGRGVLRNYSEAVKWYKKSAFQGNGNAMHDIAVLYVKGLGVSKDLIKAYAWNNVSATQGWGNAKRYREILEKMMSREQLNKAQELSTKLYEKYGAEVKD